MTLKLGAEPWDAWWPEGEALMRQHHIELGEHGVRFRLAHHSILRAERAGCVKFWIARLGGVVVGYIVWYLSEHPYSQGLIVAQQGPWFVPLAHRKSSIGPRLFIHSLRGLREMGIRLALPHHQPSANAPGLARFFTSLGAIPLETSYLMWLDHKEHP